MLLRQNKRNTSTNRVFKSLLVLVKLPLYRVFSILELPHKTLRLIEVIECVYIADQT